MTTKADISPNNWAALVDAAPAIARAVAASAGSTGQSEEELDAFVQFVSDAAAGVEGEGVLAQLVSDVSGRLAAGMEPADGDVYMDGLEQARRAGAIAAVELEPNETTAVRAWYMSGAQRVAAAAREGGVLGIGAAEISAWERETLRAIADALGVAVPLDATGDEP